MADLGHCIIDVTSDDDFVYCVISDDGPGVPQESLERLMRPFYRVDSSRTNPQEGSGLGLSIIRRIMEIFEGRVVIENVRPHGLRIILEFPKQGEESWVEHILIIGKTILDIANIERDYLMVAGYDVTIMTNGTDGIEAALNTPVDLIILDVMLPENGRLLKFVVKFVTKFACPSRYGNGSSWRYR